MSKIRVSARVGFFWKALKGGSVRGLSPWLVDGFLCLFTSYSVFFSVSKFPPLYKDTSHTAFGPTLVTSFWHHLIWHHVTSSGLNLCYSPYSLCSNHTALLDSWNIPGMLPPQDVCSSWSPCPDSSSLRYCWGTLSVKPTLNNLFKVMPPPVTPLPFYTDLFSFSEHLSPSNIQYNLLIDCVCCLSPSERI